MNKPNEHTENSPQAALTTAQAQHHFDHGGVFCPYCTSDGADCGSVKIEEGAAYQTCTCCQCGRSWTDSYHLAALIDMDGEVFDDAPIIDPAKLADMVQRLSYCLAEAHAEDKAADHYGDKGCSYCDTLAEATALLAGQGRDITSIPRIIVQVTGGLVSGIASDVPQDSFDVSILDFDNLNAMDAMPDDRLSIGEVKNRNELRRLRDEVEALPYNESA